MLFRWCLENLGKISLIYKDYFPPVLRRVQVGGLLPEATFVKSGLLSAAGAGGVGFTTYQESKVYRLAKLAGTYEGVFVKAYAFSNNNNQLYSIVDVLFSKGTSTKATARYYKTSGLSFQFFKDDTYLYVSCPFAGLVHFEIYAMNASQIDKTDVTDSFDPSSMTEIVPTAYF